MTIPKQNQHIRIQDCVQNSRNHSKTEPSNTRTDMFGMLLLYFYARHFAKKNFWILFFSHSQPRSLRPPHPFGNGTGPPERGGSLPPRDVNKYATHDSRDKYMPSGFAQQDSEQISKPFCNNNSQSRQNNTAPTQRKCSQFVLL